MQATRGRDGGPSFSGFAKTIVHEGRTCKLRQPADTPLARPRRSALLLASLPVQSRLGKSCGELRQGLDFSPI
jgi:hypothetical protein